MTTQYPPPPEPEDNEPTPGPDSTGGTPPPPPPPGGYLPPPPPGYGQPYQTTPGQPFPGTPGDMTPFGQLAQWPTRVQSALIDFVGPFMLSSLLGTITWGSGLDFVFWLAALGWALYNAYLAGQTGQSYGRKWAGTRLVRATDGQLLGGGMGIARYFLHIIDTIACYVGWLWPIWDSRRQTFADKIINTIVVKV